MTAAMKRQLLYSASMCIVYLLLQYRVGGNIASAVTGVVYTLTFLWLLVLVLTTAA
jgi:hypothetical protein